jgi:hypothetical protein
VLQLGNQVARQQPSAAHASLPVQMSADAVLDGLIADKGGADSMSTMQRSAAAKVRDIEILIAMNKSIVVRDGLGSRSGRQAHDRTLACLDRWLRLAQLLGTDKSPKPINILDAIAQEPDRV